MKRILLVAYFVLSGCTIGNGHICGPQTPQAYCDKEAYEKLAHPKPYGAHWIKEGMTGESRHRDSWACGAANTVHAADHVVFTPEQRQEVRMVADKDDYAPDKRLLEHWRLCMRDKGYTYLEECDARCMYP